MKREVSRILGKGGRGVLILAAVSLIVFGAASGHAANFPKMEIKLGHSGVVDMSYHKGSVKFAELMKERTGGMWIELQRVSRRIFARLLSSTRSAVA